MTDATIRRTTRLIEPTPQSLYVAPLPAEWDALLAKAIAEGVDVRPRYAERRNGAASTLIIPVYGSTGTCYTVNITANARGILVGCTCVAGEFGRMCKHVAAALQREGLDRRAAGK